ncbi:MAG: hypothetical protein RBU29_06195 [bacterium]|jgi:hypothetical protein|nr:hypothetical protein [bacterium]
MARSVVLILGFAWACFATGWTYCATVDLISPLESPSPPVRTGMQHLARVLKDQGWTVTETLGLQKINPTADLQILLSPFDPGILQTQDVLRDVVAPEPQSFALLYFRETPTSRVYALGRDPIGTLYAALELAEQITFADPATALLDRIKEVRGTPMVPMRGIQIALHRQALADPASWFYLNPFWEGLCLTLARARFNFIKLEGVYDWITNTEHCALPYFISLPEFPGLGLPPEKTERNLKALNSILEIAHRHGINVAFVSSRLNTAIPETASNPAPPSDESAYLRQAVRQLLNSCPGLDGIGATVAEPGQPASFYQQILFQTRPGTPQSPVFFLQTRAAPPAAMKNLLRAAPAPAILNLAWNGDFLGPSYPVTGRATPPRLDEYQDYFNLPRNYGLLFHIAANGSTRLFPWLDIAYIRRALENTTYCESNGFVLDTLFTLIPDAGIFKNNLREEHRYYDWPYQRDEPWLLAWGRLAYDKNLGEAYFRNVFNHRLGATIGDVLFEALQDCSLSIPAIESVRYHGPNKESFAPEMDPPPSFEELLQSAPFAPLLQRSVQEEAEVLLTQRRDGRRSPLESLRTAMDKAVAASQRAHEAEATLLDPSRPRDEQYARRYREWKALCIAFDTLAALVKTWYYQTSTAIHWHSFQKTQDLPSLVIAAENNLAAAAAWADAVRITSTYFTTIPKPTPNGIAEFHWLTAKTPFDEDKKKLTHLFDTWMKQPQWDGTVGHLPPLQARPNTPLLITLSVPPACPADRFFIQYQNGTGVTGQTPLEPSRINRVYIAELPEALLTEGFLEYYFFAMQGEKAVRLQDSSNTKPYRIIITADAEPPSPRMLEPSGQPANGQVTIMGRFTDPNGVPTAKLFWKSLDTTEPWQEKAMTQSTQGFTATIPATAAGVQYAVEVTDGYGNSRRIPSPDAAQPYQTIPPTTAP